MLDCVSVSNMRLSDSNTIKSGISGLELIHRAAMAVYNTVQWSGRIAVFVGGGNNGADGFALAGILKENNYDVTVISVSRNLHSDCAFYATNAEKFGVPIISYKVGETNLEDYGIIVDCLLGTGFHGPLKDSYIDAICSINSSNAYVVSVDINSGMNGDTGDGEYVVQSDLTIAIQFVKIGQTFLTAGAYMRKLKCVDIGIQLAFEEYKLCSNDEWERVSEKSTPRYIIAPKWLEM